MDLGQKSALLNSWYLLLRASGKIGRMVLQKLKRCSSTSKKLFNTVKHNFLLENRNNLGLRGRVQSFSKSHLSKRRQCGNSENVYTNFAEVDYGVPQGSVLGPLCFLVYVNDRDDYCSQNCSILYADNTVVKQKGESTTKVFSQSLNLVSDYLIKNKLTMNYEKTCLKNMKARRKSSQQQIKMKEIISAIILKTFAQNWTNSQEFFTGSDRF